MRRVILLAEDDEDDYVLIRDVLDEIEATSELVWVRDGEELMERLRKSASGGDEHLPDLVLLDLNMPRKDGRSALQEIKGDQRMRHVPVVILTTSDAESDVVATYALGANSYIIKPAGFAAFREVMTRVTDYWFRTVNLPSTEKPRRNDPKTVP